MSRIIRLLATTAVALGLVATAGVEARAATTFTPTGGPTTKFVTNRLVVTLIEPGQTITCTGASMGGAVVSPGTSRPYGADATSVGGFTATGCTQPVMGGTTITPLTSPTLAITGDASSGRWPARIKNVQWRVVWASCTFYLSGVVNGMFDPVAQSFTPNGGAVGLTIASTPAPPTGSMCVVLDLQAGDTVALSGSFVNTPPAGSSGLAITNP